MIPKTSFKLNEVPLTIEEFTKKLYENNEDFREELASTLSMDRCIMDIVNAGKYDNDIEFFTSVRVTPAAGERQHVEQQAKEENVQLSKEVEG